ncbi:MAG: hypothetical protein ACREAK_05300 [Nitrosarchaeum sp.]
MDKKNLLEFVHQIKNFNSKNNSFKAILFGYYILENENNEFFTSNDIIKCYDLIDLGKPKNIPDLLLKLKNSGKLIPRKNGFRIEKETSEKIHSLLIENGEHSENRRLEKVYTPSQEYEFYEDIKSIILTAQSEVFLIDSYASENIISLYLAKIPVGIRIMILVKNPQGKFIPIVTKFKKKHGKNFTVKINKKCHDRVFFVDKKCYVIGQSFDQAANNQPTYLCEIEKNGDFRNVYQPLFDKGKTLV